MAVFGKALHQFDEMPGLGAPEPLIVQQVQQRLVEGAAVLLGIGLQHLHAADADVPLGCIDHSAE